MDLEEIREMAVNALELNPENTGAQQVLIEVEKVHALRGITEMLGHILHALPEK